MSVETIANLIESGVQVRPARRGESEVMLGGEETSGRGMQIMRRASAEAVADTIEPRRETVPVGHNECDI